MSSTREGTADRQAIGLDALPKGVLATVIEVIAGGQQEGRQTVALRLMEIGFLPGEPVRVIAKGFPAADPLAVRVGQTTFALRRREAAMVQVALAGGVA